MSTPLYRRLTPTFPRVGEIFSLSQSGLTGGGVGFNDGGDDDGPDGPPIIGGIQTQDGQNILTQDGQVIQAQNQ